MDLINATIGWPALAGLLVLFLLCLVQSVLFFRRKSALDKASAGEEADLQAFPPLTVVVRATEFDAACLERNIPLIMNQDYPDFEVIVIDMDESDEIGDAIKRLTAQFPQLRSTFIPASSFNVSKRKLAVTLGLKAATHDIAVVTSAVCAPQSSDWLRAIARHFDDSTDIVIGYSHADYAQDTSAGHRYRVFDEVMEASRYLAAACRKRTFRGNGNNIAYRKDLFFKNKGFAETLCLKYGDDDLFVKQIATRDNVAVELSSDSILKEDYVDYAEHFRMERLHRCFTARFLKAGLRWRNNVAVTAFYLTELLAWSGIAYGIWLLWSGRMVEAAVVGGVCILLYLGYWISFVIAFRGVSRLLQAPALLFTLPVFRLVRPMVNAMQRVAAKSAKNYTWE